ncbi:NADH dehydrogenase subunit D [Desulfurobacterium pacificum]|uniref:NADH dehydrogenase subunit D n=1 Tax=Desulfurobacterium pacificum TaxID=240166 RepID=A0ABY1NJY5_9BACT|nr:NADH dehydrogenase subunit D [Desulfurobacterium pacificum]SMP11657.1 NADH dehydrogenase subunit D [Desulfurobacterium pacificum]
MSSIENAGYSFTIESKKEVNGKDLGLLKEKILQLNWGVQHPASGPMRLKVWIDGDVVVKVDPDIGYVLRLLEKLVEYRTWINAIVNVERACFMDDFGTMVGYSIAAEKIAGVEVPKKADYVRVILAEGGRIVSHLIGLGSFVGVLGVHTPMQWALIAREKFLDAFEVYSGQRIATSSIVPGGVRYEPTGKFVEKMIEAIDFLEKEFVPRYEEVFIDNPTLKIRSVDVGTVTKEKAIELGMAGPPLRASGVESDIRKDYPYAAYGELDFKVITRTEGDCYARYLVIWEEIKESARIIRQAIEGLPEGDYRVKFPVKLPPGEAYVNVEWARGCFGFHLISDGGTGPYRLKMRSPSFANLWALPEIMKGVKLADVPVIFASLYMCHGDIDR